MKLTPAPSTDRPVRWIRYLSRGRTRGMHRLRMSFDVLVYFTKSLPSCGSLWCYANVARTDRWSELLELAACSYEEWAEGEEPWVYDENDPAWDDDDEWVEKEEPWQRWMSS